MLIFQKDPKKEVLFHYTKNYYNNTLNLVTINNY